LTREESGVESAIPVRLLFDENLSGRLPQLLADTFPDSVDVVSLGLGGSSDRAIWDRAGWATARRRMWLACYAFASSRFSRSSIIRILPFWRSANSLSSLSLKSAMERYLGHFGPPAAKSAGKKAKKARAAGMRQGSPVDQRGAEVSSTGRLGFARLGSHTRRCVVRL
jgi:hypothetical protein